MDRLSSDLGGGGDRQAFDIGHGDPPAIALRGDAEMLVERASAPGSIPDRLFRLSELDVHFDARQRALWTFMRPTRRPSFTPSMLGDFELWQQLIARHFGPGRVPLDYLVLGSRAPGVFCYGGDLELFHQLIRARDREGLAAYGYRCVRILHRNMASLDLPILTIGLVQGQALGGGLEALLSFDFLIAERGASFGLPEVMFGLFPGMGAHALLSRKLGTAMANRVILSNRTYSAEDMYDLGLVSHLAAPGEGLAAAREFMARSARRHGGLVAARRAMRISAPVAIEELTAIVDLWAEAAVGLSESDLRLMSRLAAAQYRNRPVAA